MEAKAAEAVDQTEIDHQAELEDLLQAGALPLFQRAWPLLQFHDIHDGIFVKNEFKHVQSSMASAWPPDLTSQNVVRMLCVITLTATEPG